MAKRTGRPKIEDFWKEAIRMVTHNPPPAARTRGGKIGPEGVRAELQKQIDAMGKKGQGVKIPSLRAIGRIQQQFHELDEEHREPYKRFHWPESCVAGAVPWEAVPNCLELLRWYHEKWLEPPFIGIVLWFSRITALAPGAGFDDRHRAAWALSGLETTDTGGTLKRAIELWAIYQPWRSGQDREVYESVLRGTPEFPGNIVVDIDGEEVTDAIYRGMAEGRAQKAASERERGKS